MIRNRFFDAFVWRAVQGAHRHQHGPCAVSRSGRGTRRSYRRTHCGDVSSPRYVPVRRARWRSPPMPQIGYPDLVASAWVALYVPAKSPAAVIERLRTELDALLASSAFAERMKQVGIEVNRMRPDEFAAFAQQERSRWAKLIQSLDLKIE